MFQLYGSLDSLMELLLCILSLSNLAVVLLSMFKKGGLLAKTLDMHFSKNG